MEFRSETKYVLFHTWKRCIERKSEIFYKMIIHTPEPYGNSLIHMFWIILLFIFTALLTKDILTKQLYRNLKN